MRRALLASLIAGLFICQGANAQQTQPGGGGGSSTPGGTSGQIQYNNAGAFGGITATGTGNAVLATSPTLVTPALGVPSSVTLTNGTGLPITTGVSGLGTNVAAFLATPSSANLAAALTTSTGTGNNVFATSPTLVTPNLGTPSAIVLTNGTGLVASTGTTATGTPSSTTYLRGDNTWSTPGGGGTVTTTGSPASGNLAAFSGATSVTNTDLTGDVTTSGSSATTLAKVNALAGGGVQCVQVSNTGVLSGTGSGCGGSGSTGANPTATIGLSAVNGSATTYLRSDGAPALSQAIAPTWSAQHIFNAAGVASTPSVLVNGALFTGGSSTTTLPLAYFNPGGASCTGWSTSGTIIGACSGGSLNAIDIENGATSEFKISTTGILTINGAFNLGANSNLQFGSHGIISSAAASQIQLGTVDGAAASAQTLSVPSISAGTSNTNGAGWSIRGSLSTGSGTGGDISIYTSATGAAATTQNSATLALRVKATTQNIQLPAITTDSGLTDTTVCQDTTNHALFFGSGTLGICLGTSSARYKHGITALDVGLSEIMKLRPISYYLNPDHGDPHHMLYGFTAEDMQPVLPKLVGEDAQGRANTADYLGLVPVLVKAVQEQQQEIDVLKAQIAAYNHIETVARAN